MVEVTGTQTFSLVFMVPVLVTREVLVPLAKARVGLVMDTYSPVLLAPVLVTREVLVQAVKAGV